MKTVKYYHSLLSPSLAPPADYAWPLPNALCPIWIYLDVLFSTASIMHLCAISLDRYVAIRNPIEHSRFNSRTKAMLKIAVVWTISIDFVITSLTAGPHDELRGISMPIPVIGLHNQDKVFVNGSCVLNEERFMLVGSFVAFFVPLVIMVVTYCLTIQVLQRQATVFLHDGKTSSQQPLQPPPLAGDPPSSATPLPTAAASSSSSRRSSLNCLRGATSGLSHRNAPCSDKISFIPSSEVPSQLSSPSAGGGRERGGSTGGGATTAGGGGGGCRGMMQAIKNERRASKVLGIVFFLFLVMWCPFFVTNVLVVLCQHSCDGALLSELLNVFVWVGYISSGVNPLVYTLFNKTYRRAFSSYLRCRYRTAPANGVAAVSSMALLKSAPTLQVVTCPPSSHTATPVLQGRKGSAMEAGVGVGVGRAMVVVDRNSNCKNGDRSVLRGLDLDDNTDDTEMGTRGGSSGLLSVNSCHTSGEDTSSV
ncbi:hypothetical protein ACEWY4_024777 [Coilia grayii]|uniref:G-protein coupled receptors family 1 profile domain-containing protein n=1 Tax=Coilia grayii TaxID=363190 RepID=A0ABD1IVP1_9TELE